MQKYIILFFIILISCTISLQAQLDRSKMPEPGPAPEVRLGEPQTFELENGLKVFVVENHKLPTVAFSLLVDTDPVLEKEKAGFLGAVGELMRRGTATQTKEQIDEAVDFIGASLYTSSNSIYGSCLSKHDDSLLSLISEIILTPNFNQEELDKIKNQTLSQLKVRNTNPNSISRIVSDALIYGKAHPYGEFETEESWKNILLEDCRQYFLTYFRPSKAYLVVVGDMSFEEAKKKAKQYFGDWKSKPIPEHTYAMPTAPNMPQVALVDFPNAVQSVILIGYPIDFKPGSADAFSLTLANMILGNGATGRLFGNLRENHGWTYGAYSEIDNDILVGSFSATASVRNAVTDSAIAEILSEMEQIGDELITEEELRLAKNNLIGSFIRGLEDPQSIARYALRIERFGLPKDYYRNYLKKIEAVTIEDVQAAAQKYIRPDNAHIVVVGKAEELGDKLDRFGAVQYYDENANVFYPEKKDVPKGLTADKVIERYLNARGGKPALDEIKDITRVYEGKMMGQNLELSIYQKAPNLYLMKMDAGTFMQKTVFDGKTGSKSDMAGKQALAGADLEQVKLDALIFPLKDYQELGYILKLVGVEASGEEDVYQIDITDPLGNSSSQYFSSKTGLLLKTIHRIQAPDGQEYIQASDILAYQEVSGVKIPSRIVQTVGPQRLELTASELKINSDLKKSLFKVEK